MSSITAITFDKQPPIYGPGETVTATVRGNWVSPLTATFTTSDGVTGTGDFSVVQAVKGSDGGGHIWLPVSNDGAQAVLTTTA